MKRPIPVILSAVLLGILACLQLIGAVVMLVVGVAMLHHGLPQMPAGPTPLPSGFLPAMMFVLSVFYVAVAVWFILTVIGLCRLRSWARYSVLVIAGLMAALCGLLAITTVAMPFLVRTTAGLSPAPDAQIMHGVSLFIGGFYLIFTIIGIVQLVYFNRNRTRAIFQHADPVILGPPNTFTGRYRPTSISVIGWFFMICSPFILIDAFLPFPAFLFGFVLYGMAAHGLYAAYALIGFTIGYGLYRLRSAAAIAMAAWTVFGLLNMLPIFTTWGHQNFNGYMQRFTPAASLAANPFATTGFIIVCCVVGLAFNAVILWLLYRHREAFTPAPSAPPMPPDQFLEAPQPG